MHRESLLHHMRLLPTQLSTSRGLRRVDPCSSLHALWWGSPHPHFTWLFRGLQHWFSKAISLFINGHFIGFTVPTSSLVFSSTDRSLLQGLLLQEHKLNMCSLLSIMCSYDWYPCILIYLVGKKVCVVFSIR